MLKEIKCDKFSNSIKTIYFKDGLNCIVGADDALNSIGKSTLLMIIDFCFGGGDYCDKYSDILENVGQHTIYFCFEFNSEKFYFSRDTSNPNYYNICDSNYCVKGEKKNIKELQVFLKKHYFGTDIKGSFRNIVNGFSRIYGKNNYDVSKPLKTYNNDSSDKNGINVLIDLFGKKGIVDSQLNKIELAEKSKKALDASKKYGVIDLRINKKTDYEEAKQQIENLVLELNKMEKDENDAQIVLEDNISQNIIDLKTEQIVLIRKKNLLQVQLNSLTTMLGENLLMNEEDKKKLLEYFPNAELKSLTELNKFQHELIKNVNDEIIGQRELLEKSIKNIEQKLKEINDKLLNNNISPRISKTFLEAIMHKNTELVELKEQIKLYEKSKTLKDNVAIEKEKLESGYSYILNDVQTKINKCLTSLNKSIYKENRISPMLSLESFSKYSYTTPKDKGTGTEFKSLLIFDLAILELTSLPFIIDDSLLFKNIWNEPIEGLFKIYNKSRKQIFIAIDRVKVFDGDTQKIISRNQVLKLGDEDKSLFGFMWAKSNKDQNN